jgi:hypothetical protein
MSPDLLHGCYTECPLQFGFILNVASLHCEGIVCLVLKRKQSKEINTNSATSSFWEQPSNFWETEEKVRTLLLCLTIFCCDALLSRGWLGELQNRQLGWMWWFREIMQSCVVQLWLMSF